MSFLEGEKTQLNPEYFKKLIDTRLYAIKERKHQDGAIITFYCPECKHNNTIMKPLFFQSLTMDSFMHTVSSYKFETHNCVCGKKLDSNNIVIALYAHYFPDTRLDLQAEITAGSDFLAFYKMDLKGRREPLESIMDFRHMYETFGHVLSARECWKHMMKSVQETKNIQLYNVEKGYILIAMPGEKPYARVNMREIAGPDWPGESARVIKLKELEEETSDFNETYREWMPEYKNDIRSGRIDATVIIDVNALQEVLERTLNEEGMDFVIQDNNCYVVKKPFKAYLPIKEIVKEIAYRGKSFQEIIEEKVDIALNSIYSAENIYNTIKRDMPSYDISVNDDFLEITNPRSGLSEKISLYRPLKRGSIRQIVADLRENLSKSEEFRPLCKCGKDAFIIKSIEPASWLSGTKDSFNYLYEEKENAIVLYYISCGEHTRPIMKTDLAEWLVNRKDLDEAFKRELDSLRINVEAHAGAYDKDVIIGVLSNRACDIMIDPAFVKGLTVALDVDMGNKVIVYAPMKELVLIYREDATLENLNMAVMDLQNIAMKKDVNQTALDYIEVFDLDEAHGIFNIISLPDKPINENAEEIASVEAPAYDKTPVMDDAEIIIDSKPSTAVKNTEQSSMDRFEEKVKDDN
ncbi:hypothetical protein [Methanooceanicella nereidis]|nr:hypothetical protein [Methanocella sp. CWC-04]